MTKTDKQLLTAKVPPQNVQAEASLLGSILLDPEAMMKVAEKLRADDFYEQRHRLLYKNMLALFEKRRPIDVLTMSEKVERSGDLDAVGGSAYLTELANAVPSAAHVAEYAAIVAQKAMLRRLISASEAIIRLAFDKTDDDSVDDILDQAEQKLFDVSKKRSTGTFTPIGDILSESFDRMDELHKDKNKLRGVPTGFKDLDYLMAGLQNSDLIILAARPAMGKSSFVLNIAKHVALKEGIPVGIFSLEMSQDQLVDRLLAAESGVDSWKLRTGNLEDTDFTKLNEAMGSLFEAQIFIDDTPSLNSMEMRTKARRMQTEHGLGLLIVDYLQLMSSGSNSRDGRVQEVSDISRNLKALARELNIPLIAVSQLSRSVESRMPQIPQLSDLRESGSIEQDADVVMFIYREEYYNPETNRQHVADILIRKHRNGPTGEVELYWHPDRMLFRSLDKAHATQTPAA
ncbi:replicative DNA helicase [Candidatus Microgenomates bacterium]|nr:replicative DNA helicase [Candidatus Microgenomates bacterium]